ncbi:hypothetical protein D030_3376B, partial [Vibrio parahaemolyticus AQ3810]
TCRTCN